MRTKSLLLAAAAVISFASVGFGEEVKKEAGKKEVGKLITYNINMTGVT